MREVWRTAALATEARDQRLQHGRGVDGDVGRARHDYERGLRGRHDRHADTRMCRRSGCHGLQPRRVPTVQRLRNHHAAVHAGARRQQFGRDMPGELLLHSAYAAAERLVLTLQPFDRRREFCGRDRQRPVRRRERLTPLAQQRERASSAAKFHARAALEFLPASDGNHADAAGAHHVRAAAGRQIEVHDLDQPERADASRLLAQRQRCGLLGRDEPQPHLAVLPHHAVGGVFRRGDLERRHDAVQINRGRRRAQVEALGAGLARGLERR